MPQMTDLYQLSTYLPKTKAEAVTDLTAIGFTASPMWLPALQDISEIAALLLPIVGVVVAVVQISCRIYVTYKGRAR